MDEALRAANAQKLLGSQALNEARKEFRRPSPIQITNFWKNWQRYPDSRLWNHDGMLRHNHIVPNTAPGVFTPRTGRFSIPIILGGFTLAFLLNEFSWRGKNKPVFGEPEEE